MAPRPRQVLLAAAPAVVVLLAAVTVIGLARPAAACSCAANPPPREALAETGAVFAGTVTATRTIGRELDEEHVARIEVDAVWKGDVAEVVDVTAPADAGMCGIRFAPGEQWLVYAGTRNHGGFSTHACTRTAPLAFADDELDVPREVEEDLTVLAAGDDPGPGEQLASAPPPWGWIAGGAWALLLAGGAFFALRRPRRRPADQRAPPTGR